jgi:hypothetical protein
MNFFVVLVTLCACFLDCQRDQSGDAVNEREFMESDLGTGGNEDNEEDSNSISFCGSQSLAVPRVPAPMPGKLASINPKIEKPVH